MTDDAEWNPNDYEQSVVAEVLSLSFAWRDWQLTFEHDEHGRLYGFSISQKEAIPGVNRYEYHPITARLLRELPLHQLSEMAKARSVWVMNTPELNRGRYSDDEAATWAERFSGRPGAAGRGDEEYARLAARYVELVGLGLNPIKELSAGEHQAATTIRNAIYEARNRGLLTAVGRGRSGGTLTDKARALLEDHNHGQH